jgi:hypothetical protein
LPRGIGRAETEKETLPASNLKDYLLAMSSTGPVTFSEQLCNFGCQMCDLGLIRITPRELELSCDMSDRHSSEVYFGKKRFDCHGFLNHHIPEGWNGDHYIVCDAYISYLRRTYCFCGDKYGNGCTPNMCEWQQWDVES